MYKERESIRRVVSFMLRLGKWRKISIIVDHGWRRWFVG
jgi:hypothetical protein